MFIFADRLHANCGSPAQRLLALVMNLAGGLAFAAAIVVLYQRTGSIELQALTGEKQALALLPAALLCFAGITKSAQLPFSSWLLGAMVAPTPVSALLHSSTMVKAGVYLVLRMAPVVEGTKTGLLVALVGGLTFVVASFAAITASDAKRVLAWSTVANLGLIVLCGGIGTHEAVWAGILLIIFHAWPNASCSSASAWWNTNCTGAISNPWPVWWSPCPGCR